MILLVHGQVPTHSTSKLDQLMRRAFGEVAAFAAGACSFNLINLRRVVHACWPPKNWGSAVHASRGFAGGRLLRASRSVKSAVRAGRCACRQSSEEADLLAKQEMLAEAALTLDLDLSRVEASEAFDWTQAPLKDGALLLLERNRIGLVGAKALGVRLPRSNVRELVLGIGPKTAIDRRRPRSSFDEFVQHSILWQMGHRREDSPCWRCIAVLLVVLFIVNVLVVNVSIVANFGGCLYNIFVKELSRPNKQKI
ncbi:unnamed protein product [Polarella glacialis]|uniref:Uncharacterized protein n=1 Tax=Polarella glacialis TaxID=89957 RepID=A0A813G6P1_POLGL|nr:unnamed protein product [Polarella glacialis]